MGEPSILHDISLWIQALPIKLSYRIVWLCAKLGSPHAREVYQAMWDANLSLPELNNESNIK